MYKIMIMTLQILLSIGLNAKTIVSSDNSELKLTLYNNNTAFIDEKRTAEVKRGRDELVYEGVPKSLVSSSVKATFSGMKTTLYSQNYMYDLITLDSMLKKSVGLEVSYYKNSDTNLSRGVLLNDLDSVMIRDNITETIYTLDSSTQVVFDTIPEDMITKPSLIWNMNIEKTGKLEIDLKYLTKGVSWKSDYVLNLRKGSLDLMGWITVNNNSGVNYNNAQITCLAGDVNIAKKRAISKRRKKTISYSSPMQERMEVKEESFSGYHIYKIPFKETIKDKQQKQISFIDKKDISYKQYGVSSSSYFENYGTQVLSFSNTIELMNTAKNNLGIPLPKGIVRMYSKDSSMDTHFIGEYRVKNIPKDEKIKLTIGRLFDIVGKKTITKYISKKGYKNVETTYEISNRGKESMTLKLDESMPVHGHKVKVSSSCSSQCKIEKKSAFVRQFVVTLKPDESYKFTSEFKINF